MAGQVRDGTTADLLSALHGVNIKDIDGGFRVRETETHVIDIHRMIFNWRITRTAKNKPLTYDRAWCFYGTDIISLLRTVKAAVYWDGADDTAPEGWDKNVTTGEYSRPDQFRE
jgi:hypothetical protein